MRSGPLHGRAIALLVPSMSSTHPPMGSCSILRVGTVRKYFGSLVPRAVSHEVLPTGVDRVRMVRL